jgi:hypothetical protein
MSTRIYTYGKKKTPEDKLRTELRKHILSGGLAKSFNLLHGSSISKMLGSMGIRKVFITDEEHSLLIKMRAALALGQENCDAVYDELRTDCDELRADVVRLTARAERTEAAETVALAKWNGALERALKAEANLAVERARLDWLESPSGMDWQWEPERLTVSRASIDAAMKEDAKSP